MNIEDEVILDLFACAGCAGVGYERAGFGVVSVDIEAHPNNPHPFVQADALEVLRRLIDGQPLVVAGRAWRLEDFVAVHASPPCQHFTKYGNAVKDIKERYENLLEPTRELLQATGLPYVIENVERAPLIDPVKLCGSMFDGAGTHDIQRHRLFETNWPLEAPSKCDHSIWAPNRYPGGRSGERGGSWVLCRKTIEVGRWSIPLETQKWAMGVDWKITQRELSEAVPPAYTEYVGKALRAYLADALTEEAAA